MVFNNRTKIQYLLKKRKIFLEILTTFTIIFKSDISVRFASSSSHLTFSGVVVSVAGA